MSARHPGARCLSASLFAGSHGTCGEKPDPGDTKDGRQGTPEGATAQRGRGQAREQGPGLTARVGNTEKTEEGGLSRCMAATFAHPCPAGFERAARSRPGAQAVPNGWQTGVSGQTGPVLRHLSGGCRAARGASAECSHPKRSRAPQGDTLMGAPVPGDDDWVNPRARTGQRTSPGMAFVTPSRPLTVAAPLGSAAWCGVLPRLLEEGNGRDDGGPPSAPTAAKRRSVAPVPPGPSRWSVPELGRQQPPTRAGDTANPGRVPSAGRAVPPGHVPVVRARPVSPADPVELQSGRAWSAGTVPLPCPPRMFPVSRDRGLSWAGSVLSAPRGGPAGVCSRG